MSSRVQIAQYLADTLISGGDRQRATREAAAWLKVHGRSRQAGYLARDVAEALNSSGYLYAVITTAKPATAAIKNHIESYLKEYSGAKSIECDYLVDPKLIGGVLLETPLGTLDASVRAELAKIVEGVSR